MLIPKRRVALIASALRASAPSEARTVGGSAETEANAVTVMPHGRSPTRQVTSTTPLARALIASANSRVGARSTAESAIRFRAVDMVCRFGVRGLRARQLHRHGDAVGDHVEDGRALLRTHDQLLQLLLRRVA